MLRACRFLLVALVLGTVAASTVVLGGQRGAEPYDLITHSSPAGHTDVWRIDRPSVKERVTAYPGIPLAPGDRLWLEAGGCVQTGGTGRTWKRFVNPAGRNADRLYFGQADIPFVTPGLVPIRGLLGRQIDVPGTLPAGAPAPVFSLGYMDDAYDDNGYWGHDDGDGDQCKAVGPAFVVLTIQHHPVGPAQNPIAPFDLVWTDVDENYLPLNPTFALQRSNPERLPGPHDCVGKVYEAPCTTQSPAQDTYKELCPTGSLGGHANWGAATFEGAIYWESHSLESQDDDYNFNLLRPDHAALTSETEGPWLHMEFSSDETIDHFHTPFWQTFHAAVDDDDSRSISQPFPTDTQGRNMVRGRSKAAPLVYARPAIATGLFGLDCAHSCGSELHPVWALAIHLDDDQNDDKWAMFVRNWGNEGYCSQFQHYLDRRTYTFRISRPGARGVALAPGSEFRKNRDDMGGPVVSLVPGEGALVTFTLPPPEAGGRINGELHLKWEMGASPDAALRKLRPVASSPAVRPADQLDNEARARREFFALRPDQRMSVVSALATPAAPDTSPTAAALGTPSSSLRSVRGAQVVLTRDRFAPDSRRVATEPQRRAALAAANANVVANAASGSKVPSSPAVIDLPANTRWLDTGITLRRGQRVRIEATGTWSNTGPASIGPAGFAGSKFPGVLLASADLGALIGRVGQTMFPIGPAFDGQSPATGRLFLSMNDTPDTFGDNQGKLQVRITLPGR